MEARQTKAFAGDAAAKVTARQYLLARGPVELDALLVAAHAIHHGQVGRTLSPAEATHGEAVESHLGGRPTDANPGTHAANTTSASDPELDHGFECERVGQCHDPEELGPSTTLMEVDFNGILLLLEDLSLMFLGPAVEMEESVAICAEVAARVAHDDGERLGVVMVVASRPWGWH